MPSIERDGARLAYEVAGEGQRACLLLHDLLLDRTVFAQVAPRLADGRRVLSLDQRGHGESRATRRFDVADLAQDALAVLDAEGVERAAVVGVSLGASVALELALASPARVTRLALLGATARPATAVDRLKNGALALAVRCLGPRRFLLGQALPLLFGRTTCAERADVVARWRARLDGLDPRGTYHAVRAWLRRPAYLDRLVRVTAPTLVVVGDEDAAHPLPHADEIAAAIPGARLEVVPRAGHTLPLEAPERVADLLAAFLASEP